MTNAIRPSPTQLGGWLADGKEALRIAAGPLRLWAALKSGRATRPQARRVIARIIVIGRDKLAAVSAALAAGLAARSASLAGWFADFAGAMAPSFYAAALAGLGTLTPSPADVRASDDQVAAQYAWLAGFRRDLRDGSQPTLAPLAAGSPPDAARTPSAGFLNRSSMYADAAWSVAENVVRARMTREGFLAERWMLGGSSHSCRGCLNQASMGWVPIGSSPSVGSHACRSKCRCTLQYSRINIIGTSAALIAAI